MTASNLTLNQKRYLAIDIVGKGSESAAAVPSVNFAGNSKYDEYGNPISLVPAKNPAGSFNIYSNSGYSFGTIQFDLGQHKDAVKPLMEAAESFLHFERPVCVLPG